MHYSVTRCALRQPQIRKGTRGVKALAQKVLSHGFGKSGRFKPPLQWGLFARTLHPSIEMLWEEYPLGRLTCRSSKAFAMELRGIEGWKGKHEAEERERRSEGGGFLEALR